MNKKIKYFTMAFTYSLLTQPLFASTSESTQPVTEGSVPVSVVSVSSTTSPATEISTYSTSSRASSIDRSSQMPAGGVKEMARMLDGYFRGTGYGVPSTTTPTTR